MIRVATVPYAHPYLDAVLPANVVRVGPPPPPGEPWAPSPWLDPAYLAAHADEVDVVHLHFGFDGLTPDEMLAWTETVRRSRVALVVTVHDLRNPHHSTRERHDRHLAALLGAAEVVLTLTEGAADEIAERFSRSCIVVAHPGLVTPLPDVGREPRLVGVHLKSLRTNLLDPLDVVRAAASGAVSAGGRLRVDVHDDVDLGLRVPGLVEGADAGEYELVVHGRFADDELTTYLQTLAVSVLPHRFGTHSGWLEACRDVGTRVVAPTCGHYADQWDDVVLYGNDEVRGLDTGSLTAAVLVAVTRPWPARADPAWRAEQRTQLRRVHDHVYGRVAADHHART
ncbi:glycosyltransferase [Klenkia terrae]|uniref:Glycosyltransferase n=1 Tax=Klenkia terrae TaxID=1052259 RepID=A0ABU8E7I5_9ACTN|nr:glycosyltransferase [Klenkia terrae]